MIAFAASVEAVMDATASLTLVNTLGTVSKITCPLFPDVAATPDGITKSPRIGRLGAETVTVEPISTYFF